MLDINGTNIKDTVGDKFDVTPASINANCTYDLDIGNLTIPEKATTLGGEAKAEHVKLHVLLQTEISRARARRTGRYSDPALAGYACRLLPLC